MCVACSFNLFCQSAPHRCHQITATLVGCSFSCSRFMVHLASPQCDPTGSKLCCPPTITSISPKPLLRMDVITPPHVGLYFLTPTRNTETHLWQLLTLHSTFDTPGPLHQFCQSMLGSSPHIGRSFWCQSPPPHAPCPITRVLLHLNGPSPMERIAPNNHLSRFPGSPWLPPIQI